MYLNLIMPDKFNKTLEQTRKIIKLSKIKFDTIACRGISGTSLAIPLAAILKSNLCICRKEQSHGFELEIFKQNIYNYIIVDDFVHIGNTIKKIKEGIQRQYSGIKLEAVYLYNPKSCNEDLFEYVEDLIIPIYKTCEEYNKFLESIPYYRKDNQSIILNLMKTIRDIK